MHTKPDCLINAVAVIQVFQNALEVSISCIYVYVRHKLSLIMSGKAEGKPIISL